MSVYEAGHNPRPEDEREQEAWADPPDAAADDWRGGEPPNQGDEWKHRHDWTGTPEERMYGDLVDDDEGEGS